MEKIRKLTADEIEAKVKQVSEKGCQLLLYKTARTDRQILDEAFGAMNWTSDYKEIKGNLYCGIGCRESEEKPFVWKWDCGVESREDGEGNEKKGEASDSFKRAGFQWGIGVELYTSPFIWVNVETIQQETRTGKKVWVLKDKFLRFSVAHIKCDDETGKICELLIVDDKGNELFSFPKKKQQKPEKTEFEKQATAEKTARTKALKAGKDLPAQKKPLSERFEKAIKYLKSYDAPYTKSVIDSVNIIINDLCGADMIAEATELRNLFAERTGTKDDALEAILNGEADFSPYAI